MGTKNDPGKFDCYAKAQHDEPMFVLLARDPLAPILVELWASLRSPEIGNAEKVIEARQCAAQMRQWHRANTLRAAREATVKEPKVCVHGHRDVMSRPSRAEER